MSKPAVQDLQQRLGRLRIQRPQPQTGTATEALAVEELARRLQGRCLTEGVILIRKRFPLQGTLGRIDLASLPQCPDLPGAPVAADRRTIYIDTETTGLSGGSGTLAFLIGMAVIADDTLELSQYLLSRFSAEADLLSAFAEALSADDKLVSYNGKSFDLPLLFSRYRMQALPPPSGVLLHLDLLHPVRRLFRHRWQDCRLNTLEEKLLGFRRRDDLPGAEAPAAWFSYLRHAATDRLLKVVAHNRQDIVSLAVAHRVLSRATTRPLAYDVDLYELARWWAETDEAHARALLECHMEHLCSNGQRLLGRLSRRAGNWLRAVEIWKGLAAGGCAESAECLAKYHEHVSKDLNAALDYCRLLPSNTAHAHRIRRLKDKLRKRPNPQSRQHDANGLIEDESPHSQLD